MHLTLEYQCMILTLLTLTTGSWATTTSVWDFTNKSKDCAGVGATHRVRIPPFSLVFYPATVLTETQREVIKESAEDVLLDFFTTKVNEGVTVDFVDLTIKRNHALIRRRRHLQDDNTAVLPFAGGIAKFQRGEPALYEVNAWTSQALEGNLLEMLQAKSELTTVESIVFSSLTAPPTVSPPTPSQPTPSQTTLSPPTLSQPTPSQPTLSPPTLSPTTPQVIESVSSVESTQSSPPFIVIFVACVVGGFAFVSLVVLAALSL